jgi:hypothetical protein
MADPVLCDLDSGGLDRPVFSPVADLDQLFRTSGLYANREGEVFQILVTGPDPSAVGVYARDLLVCLDHQYVDEPIEDGPIDAETDTSSIRQELAGEDLFVEASFVGTLDDLDPELLLRVLDEVAAEPDPGAQIEWLAEFGLLFPGRSPAYVVDFVYDPKVGAGATHHYGLKFITKYWVRTSVFNGRATAAVCRNSSYPHAALALSAGGDRVGEASDARNWPALYDFAVKGRPLARYKVAGRWKAGTYQQQPVSTYWFCRP